MHNLEGLKDLLELMGDITHVKVSEPMIFAYLGALESITDEQFAQAAKMIFEDGKFPSVTRIKELAIGGSITADWHKIMSVVNGNQKSAVISGISDRALAIVTSTNSSLGAMRWLIDASEFQISQTRKDWEKLISIPPDPKSLPPAQVTITFEVPPIKIDGEDRDTSYVHRTAATIQCIKDKGAISAAWIPIIDSYPAEKRREIYEYAAANNFASLGNNKSIFYNRSISTAKAMLEIDEQEISRQISLDRAAARLVSSY